MEQLFVLSETTRQNELMEQERRKLEKAVEFINAKVDEAVHTLLDIGNYLLHEFFENDLSKVRNRAPRKSISLRKLAECERLNISYRSLCNAVNLAIQERRFFRHNPTFRHLTESHKLLLLNLGNDSEIVSYAKQTVERKLSVRDLKLCLIDHGHISPRGRRSKLTRTKPDAFRKLNRLMKPLVKIRPGVINDIDIEKISNSDRSKLKESALNAKQMLEDLIEQLSRNR